MMPSQHLFGKMAVGVLSAAFLAGCFGPSGPTADELKAALNELTTRKNSKVTNLWEHECTDRPGSDGAKDGVIWSCSYKMRSYAYGTERGTGVFLYVDEKLKEAKRYKRLQAEKKASAKK